MILLRGLDCPSSISFVEVSERGLWRLSAVLAIHMWHSVKTNEKCLKNNLSPRFGCSWAISRRLVSVHVNVYSTKSVADWLSMVEWKTHKMQLILWSEPVLTEMRLRVDRGMNNKGQHFREIEKSCDDKTRHFGNNGRFLFVLQQWMRKNVQH